MRVMTQRRYQRIQQMLRHRQPDLTLIAEDVHKPHNLSAILRSADAVGVERVHATNPTGGLPTYSATSASAERWVELLVHPDLPSAVASVRSRGVQLLAAHFAPDALDFRAVDYTRPTCILFGNERDGVSTAAAAAADACIIIPMLGLVPSLNVSVASALVLFEAQRQRLAAGMYDSPRLSADEIERRTTRILFPRESERLERAGLPLPTLTPSGELPASTAALLARLPGGAEAEFDRDPPPKLSVESAVG
jgi:tRNA (guanosine-2'-O-)-methyltransferase